MKKNREGMIPAISVRQPWAHLIMVGKKDVENRSRPWNYEGPVVIHASKKWDWDGWNRFASGGTLGESFCPSDSFWPEKNSLAAGGIVGIVEKYGDGNDEYARNSRWFTGPYGWMLRSPEILPFTRYKGKLGIFYIPEKLIEELRKGGNK